ncbi:hypothetical protein [Streptomyces scabichelini]|nr:hypothetical protein [Streptomyces scabichelini]
MRTTRRVATVLIGTAALLGALASQAAAIGIDFAGGAGIVI